jgi:pyruvate dehydrogenase E2 component (dihydrolipoamide acetyltransferase)
MEFRLPELGEGVHEGELVNWKVKVGDSVNFDQPLCEIMTDKATVELPSAFKGKVAQIHAKVGEVVHVGQLMLTLEGAAAQTGAVSPAAASSTQEPHPNPKSSTATSATPPAAGAVMPPSPMASAGLREDLSPATRVAAAPSTRRFAREQGIELASVSPTGPHGRVLREDVERALSGGSSAATGAATGSTYSAGAGAVSRGAEWKSGSVEGGEERVPFRGLRKKISEKMRLSKDKAAHFTYVEEADATELVRLRAEAKELGKAAGVKVTYLPFVMKAMAMTLRKFPVLNSTLDEAKQELVYKHYYNIGLSVQTDDGLTAPVIKDVGNKSILQIAKEIEAVVERARDKKLTLDDLQGGTITLTNAGSIGGLFATPVINFPEVAILGFNKIFRKPVVKVVAGTEQVVIRDWTYFSISLDHRIVDGAVAAEFLKAFIKLIENPSLMLLEN